MAPVAAEKLDPSSAISLRLDRLACASVSDRPFRHMTGDSLLDPDKADVLAHDFPDPGKTGFFPVDELTFGSSFASLIEQLKSPDFVAAVGEGLGMDLAQHPQLIVVRRWSAKSDGRVHTDGEDKVATFLVYLNDDWSGSAGALRYLEGADVDGPGTQAIPARFGVFTAFRRSDHSWHGHPPFEGERRVVQVFWLRDADALARKTRRHARTAFWKIFSKKVG